MCVYIYIYIYIHINSVNTNSKIFDLGLSIIYFHKWHIFRGTCQMNYVQNESLEWPKKFICKMEWLDANQVNFRGQLPKIMTWSDLLQCWGPVWNCAQCVHSFYIQRRSQLWRRTRGSGQSPANIKVVHRCPFEQGQDFP